MIYRGNLIVESPIYRGNARKTLFTRDGDGTQRLVSLAGEIEGTAQALMDAFIGKSRDGRNIGLLDSLWLRLYQQPLPDKLINKVECKLKKEYYPRDKFFDLRMGIKLDEDRWAAEANANYKMETLFRNSVFDFALFVQDAILKKEDNAAKLHFVLHELVEGRFWFGAGKSKGLGRCRLELNTPLPAAQSVPASNSKANQLSISLRFNSLNPLLVSWNWGKIDPDIPAFAAIDGRLLVEAMRNLPDIIRDRLALAIGGPILSPEDWKRRLAEYLPRIIAIILRDKSMSEGDAWLLPDSALKKLQKGKFPISKKIIEKLEPLCTQPFATKQELSDEITKMLGKKANLANRIIETIESEKQTSQQFDKNTWKEIATTLGLNLNLSKQLEPNLDNEQAMVEVLATACKKLMPQFSEQVDRQVKLLQSDAWIEVEISNREDHIKIKSLLREGKIGETDWVNPGFVPEGVKPAAWKEFLDSHPRVNFKHLLNTRNLEKSITNDRNHIEFLNTYRDRTRQELSQPHNTDFRAGGISNREISKKYGKPYDNIFMRMLVWTPSKPDGSWEVFIPGSTIKGAFRKRASQVLKTLWGETPKTQNVLDSLFGTQGKRGLVFFSDAYLMKSNDDTAWCSMDGVRMDARTGQPIEEAKADYLYAYGENLSFDLKLNIQDISEKDADALGVLSHLIQDFTRGDIPLGSQKTSGFGWVEAEIDELQWQSVRKGDVATALFGEQKYENIGIWQTFSLSGTAALNALQNMKPIRPDSKQIPQVPPKSSQGFISHRSFGGYCGRLSVGGTVLTPLSIQESGEPSYRAMLGEEPVNGWDFFSFSQPEAMQRADNKRYALPSKSIRGMLRHIYTIASNSKEQSTDINRLNPVDGLFGWVGNGPNQAIAGRISISFAVFDKPELAWFKIPYPYGNWQFVDGEWKHINKARVEIKHIADEWRIFPHVPLAPVVEKMDEFKPDTVQASYMRAILPGAHCRFSIRFWNLEKAELERLIWCLALEDNLAHKMGKGRYVGFGSIRLNLLPESYLIRWEDRYSGGSSESWREPLKMEDWKNTSGIENYDRLREVLNAKQI
ncbi:hypothetical protein JXJ21_21600 [candidate division KSB1 bacterium]|nr:hypothetical protein [candidate division KSB1 bacterium]